MYHEFSEIIARFGLWDGVEPVLLAVSGGVDSMCMADLFRRTGLRFAVAHCNFHLRGADSDADEALVRDWAAASGAGFHKADFDTVEFAESHGVSIEMAARELRYRWFVDLCRSSGYKALCVAHNANDNAETLFLNIVRGTGLKGLAGMAPDSPAPYSGTGGGQVRLLRPLLGFTRKQIEGYASSHSVAFREDRTNAGTDYRRNRIRHLVFPVLEQMNPSFIRTVSGEMSVFAQAGAVADSYFRSVSGSLVSEEGDDVCLSLGKLMELEHWEYVLYRFLDGYGFNRSAVASLSALLKSGRTVAGKYFRTPDHILLTAGGRLIVRPAASPGAGIRKNRIFPEALDTGGGFTVVRGEGQWNCNGTSFFVEVVPRASVTSLKQPSGILIFDADRLQFPFVCRPWREGDWFIPLGMKGKKKVSDFFTDLKYDIFRKSGAVVVVDTSSVRPDERRIAAVLGERIDDSFKVTQSTERVLAIRIQ